MDRDDVFRYIDRTGPFVGYEEQLATLMKHPRGYRYCFAVYFCDADICNGGFEQLFYNPTGTMTVVAIEGIERMGRPDIAELLRNALRIETRSGESKLGRIVPTNYFDGYRPSFDTFEDLDSRYYAILGDDHNGYFSPLIDRYVAQCPSDFEEP